MCVYVCVCVENVRLDDEAVLDSISVTQPAEMTSTPLTATQQALLLGLWSVLLSSMVNVTVLYGQCYCPRVDVQKFCTLVSQRSP